MSQKTLSVNHMTSGHHVTHAGEGLWTILPEAEEHTNTCNRSVMYSANKLSEEFAKTLSKVMFYVFHKPSTPCDHC